MLDVQKRVRGALSCIVGLTSAVLLSACGGGGNMGVLVDGAGDASARITVNRQSLPPGSRDEAYPTVQLTATGAPGAQLAWRLDGGALPRGITLTSSGALVGTPTERGVFLFGVHVQANGLSGTCRLALAVDALGLLIDPGVPGESAWSGHPVRVEAVGQTGPTLLNLIGGGQLIDIDTASGRATLVPPAVPAGERIVRVQVSEPETGRSKEVLLSVRRSPVDGFRAEFGTTDVWYIDGHAKAGNHGYQSDMHAALVAAGLRATASTDWLGTPADRLAAMCVRKALLRQLSLLFLREADGRAGGEGVAISFPFEEPGPGHAHPSTGMRFPGTVNAYSVIGLVDGTRPSVVGTAHLDTVGNPIHENNTTVTGGGDEYGVFVNRLVTTANAVYANRDLPRAPVGPEDLIALDAILHDLPSPGGRYKALKRIIDGFGRTLATVCAHEIGHSVGFEHTYPAVSGSIMNSVASLGPTATPAFLPARIDLLRGTLPGPGRAGAFFKRALNSPPSLEGIATRVCNCRLFVAPRRVRASGR